MKLVHTAYIQQQLHCDAAQVLCIVATSQLLAFIIECLCIIIMLCYFCEVASCFTGGIMIL